MIQKADMTLSRRKVPSQRNFSISESSLRFLFPIYFAPNIFKSLLDSFPMHLHTTQETPEHGLVGLLDPTTETLSELSWSW
jgi:hypothetical protein